MESTTTTEFIPASQRDGVVFGWIGNDPIVREGNHVRIGDDLHGLADVGMVILAADPRDVLLVPGVRLDEVGHLTANLAPVRAR